MERAESTGLRARGALPSAPVMCAAASFGGRQPDRPFRPSLHTNTLGLPQQEARERREL